MPQSPRSSVLIPGRIQLPRLPLGLLDLVFSSSTVRISTAYQLTSILRSLSRRLRILNAPVHLHPYAMVDCGNMMLHAGRLNLHRPVEIHRLESSRPTTRIDLSLGGSWLDPHVRRSCVLDRLEVVQLVLIIVSSQDPVQNRQLRKLTTMENMS